MSVFKRAEWRSGLTYRQICQTCQTVVRYTDDKLDFRPWYADGFVYCPVCNTPLRHRETYAIDGDNMTKFMRPTHKNLNDNTIEGFEITSLGIYAVQFEPEGAPGPCESSIILDEWVNIMKRDINRINEVKNER